MQSVLTWLVSVEAGRLYVHCHQFWFMREGGVRYYALAYQTRWLRLTSWHLPYTVHHKGGTYLRRLPQVRAALE